MATRPSRFGLLIAALAVFAVPRSALAQTAIIGGTVVRDSSGTAVGGAEVSIAGTGRTARTNYLGEFRLDRLPAGTYVLVTRHVGFAARTDTIALRDGQAVDNEFMLTAAPVELSAQRTVESAEKESLYLQEFNDRMKVGFGRFVPETVLRKEADSRSFTEFLKGKLPGMRVVRENGEEYLASGRKACDKPAFLCTNQSKGCMVSVYVDGIADYVSGATQRAPTNFSALKSEDFAAVEFYASGATAPAKYNQTGSDCGVLLLWRRYRAP